MGRPPGRKNAAKTSSSTTFSDQAVAPPKLNVDPAIIAKALTEMLEFDREIASLAGLKGGAITRYEQQGVDRELLAALNKLGRKDQNEARAYIQGLTQYAAAAKVINLADNDWTLSVKQADMFMAAKGDVADELSMARSRRQGWTAGKKGRAIESNPYAARPGSPEFVGWRDGHKEGADLRKVLKPGSENVQRAPAERKPRAPRKQRNGNGEEPDTRTQLEKDTDAYRAKTALPDEKPTVQ